ncbi:hypothetical protein TNIN_430251 [Trichonephila inaurata madagascariensis]|uniref:Uncharacterized protein n=1 Tax=Trichonephila inaurata madagascariensis TaxID=2747483 RepID=A0A8X6MLT8_9ARAC|nr:hypothetical protein TNIN_430251 [Trichonephila inaurata madagascariensis]
MGDIPPSGRTSGVVRPSRRRTTGHRRAVAHDARVRSTGPSEEGSVASRGKVGRVGPAQLGPTPRGPFRPSIQCDTGGAR